MIANCISLVAALFTCASSISRNKVRIYYYQVVQCLVLAIASFFFHSYAGIITLLLCGLRNFLLAKERFGKITCSVIAVLMLVLGLLINNNGYIGYIVIFANVLYTIGGYIARKEIAIKINIIIDLTLWIIYEILIIDLPSLISDVVALILAVISIFVALRSGKIKDRNVTDTTDITNI